MRFLISLLYLFITLMSSSLHANTLEFWSAFGDEVDSDIAHEFYEKTGNTLAIRKFSINEIKAELLVAAKSKNRMPDAVWVPSDFLGLHDFLDLQAIPQEWIKDDRLEPAALANGLVGNTYMGLPVFLGNHLMLFYNKSYVETPITSWEALLNLSREFPKTSQLSLSIRDMYFFAAFFSLFHADTVLDKIQFDDQASIDTLTFYRNMSTQLGLTVACDSACNRANFLAEKTAYLIDGDWALAELYEALGQDLGIATLPTYRNVPMKSLSGSRVVAMTSFSYQHSEKRAMLKALFSILQDTVFQQEMVHKYQYISSLKAVNHTTFVMKKGIMLDVYQQYLNSQPMPNSLRVSFIWEALSRGAARNNDGMPEEESMAYIQYMIEKFSRNVEGAR